MCGFFGSAQSFSNRGNGNKWKGELSSHLHHRGPDYFGKWKSTDGRVSLFHNRLSIIDLSDEGNQPMVDTTGNLTIVFNGEIYNHKFIRNETSNNYNFQSFSDTEAILAAYGKWGVDCANHLEGMFSFALYDSTLDLVLMSRDRVGEKPLFYQYSDGVLNFSSELKPILEGNKDKILIDPISMDCYFYMGFVPGDRCILSGFNKLQPAHSLVFNLKEDKIKIWKYWSLPNQAIISKPNSEDLVSKLESLLSASVDKQMNADVPLGVLLSGGIDSSLITAIASRYTDKLKTFTVGFPDNNQLDETKYARLVAKHYNTDHHELQVESATPDLLIKLAKQFDEPIIDSSMIPTFMVSEMVQTHCKVVLGGDGADELFGGYRHYSQLHKMESLTSIFPEKIRLIISYFSKKYLPTGFKGKNWFSCFGYDVNSEVPLIASYFDFSDRENMFNGRNPPKITAEKIWKDRSSGDGDIITRATHADFNNYLPEDILVKVDRASMLTSLEVRTPFLDKELIEFAFRDVPPFLKTTQNNKKILLKKLAVKILPKEFDINRKQGFSIPLNDWIRKGDFREFFYDTLLNYESIYDQRYVKTLLKNQDKGFNNGERLFALVMFELWRKQYNITI
jgi:asparagine synthase (glutamine-hydrolysing)